MKRRTMLAIFLCALDGGLMLWPVALDSAPAVGFVAAVALSITAVAAVVHDAWHVASV